MTEKLITLKEAAKLLSISPEEVERWVREGRLPAFQICGEYLRFRREEIERFKRERFEIPSSTSSAGETRSDRYGFLDGLYDFFYFNDFYLVSFFLAVAALWAILTF